MGKLETIIFDYDGTIANTREIIIECVKKLGEKYNFKVPSDEEIERLRALHAEDFIKNHLGIPMYKIPCLLAEGWELFSKKRESILPYDGMVKIIKNLARDYDVIVLSSNKHDTIASTFNKWGLKCDDIRHSTQLFGKHHELKKIISEKRMKYSRDKLIYVGDEVRDINACHNAKIGMLAVTWGLNNEEAFRNIGFPREYIVISPAEMEKRLREL